MSEYFYIANMLSRSIGLVEDSITVSSMILNEHIDGSAIQDKVRNASNKVKIKLATQQNHPAHLANHIFSALAKSDIPEVTHALASNPTATADSLRIAHQWRDSELRRKIENHPNAPIELKGQGKNES